MRRAPSYALSLAIWVVRRAIETIGHPVAVAVAKPYAAIEHPTAITLHPSGRRVVIAVARADPVAGDPHVPEPRSFRAWPRPGLQASAFSWHHLRDCINARARRGDDRRKKGRPPARRRPQTGAVRLLLAVGVVGRAVVAIGHPIAVAVTQRVALAIPAAALECPASFALFPAVRMPIHPVAFAHPVPADPVMAAVAPRPHARLPDVAGTRRRNHLVARRGRRHVDVDADLGRRGNRESDRRGGNGGGN